MLEVDVGVEDDGDVILKVVGNSNARIIRSQ